MVNMPNNESPNAESVLLEWNAASRPFIKRTKEFYRTVGSIVFLFVVILFFVQEYLLIIAILSILFVSYVLSTVPPENLHNKITTLGIQTAEHFHKWEEMNAFWFDAKYGQKMLVVRLIYGFPAHLQLLIPGLDETKLKQILSGKLPFQDKPERTFLDNAATWITQKIPLEKVS
jgi:hypothetical protein